MRHYIYLDTKVSDAEYKAWEKEDYAFWKQYAGIENTYEVERMDFSSYPTYTDSDGDKRPVYSYLTDLTEKVEYKYGKWAYENIMLMIHEDNWVSDPPGKGGIWGTNYSYTLSNGHLQYCRVDRDNPANTFGTAYHERMHAIDALCYTEAGVNVNPIVKTTNYDNECVHGNSARYEYIRYKENLDALQLMAPAIQKAVLERKKKHLANLKEKVSLLQMLQSLRRKWREMLSMKDGIPRS